jgi:hypothetical protein
MSTLLKECRAGLQEGIDFFQVSTAVVMSPVPKEKMFFRSRVAIS